MLLLTFDRNLVMKTKHWHFSIFLALKLNFCVCLQNNFNKKNQLENEMTINTILKVTNIREIGL